MNVADLTGKKLALVAFSEDKEGETEAAVFTGIARWTNGHMYMDRGEGQKPFQVPDDILDRIEPVPANISDIVMGADFFVTTYIWPLPDDADAGQYEDTGLKWPKQPETRAGSETPI